ncbi:MAG: RnfABCDGE type electron transport complex subunit D [Proteobacteria bacterium]|nr:RnfABCDGE type electron transport complex subunit D [Pseudomonadota bacterium]
MTSQDTEHVGAMASRRPPSLPERADIALLALLPTLAVRAWQQPSPVWIGIALLALILPLLRRLLPSVSASRGLLIAPNLLLLAAWMPATAPHTLGLALLACVVLAAIWRGRDAAHPFHPAMIAAALALIVWPAPVDSVVRSDAALLPAVASALGGLLLIGRGVVRWQAPAGLLAGAALTLLVAMMLSPALDSDPLIPALLSPLVLTAFFVADDPPRTCLHARARGLLGALTGAMAMAAMLALHILHRDPQVLLALAGVMLLGNAAAPTFDRLFATPRTPRASTP